MVVLAKHYISSNLISPDHCIKKINMKFFVTLQVMFIFNINLLMSQDTSSLSYLQQQSPQVNQEIISLRDYINNKFTNDKRYSCCGLILLDWESALKHVTESHLLITNEWSRAHLGSCNNPGRALSKFLKNINPDFFSCPKCNQSLARMEDLCMHCKYHCIHKEYIKDTSFKKRFQAGNCSDKQKIKNLIADLIQHTYPCREENSIPIEELMNYLINYHEKNKRKTCLGCSKKHNKSTCAALCMLRAIDGNIFICPLTAKKFYKLDDIQTSFSILATLYQDDMHQEHPTDFILTRIHSYGTIHDTDNNTSTKIGDRMVDNTSIAELPCFRTMQNTMVDSIE